MISAKDSKSSLRFTALSLILLLAGCASMPPDCYQQPLAVDQSVYTLAHPDGRETQVTLWQPAEPGQYPLLAFSHGAFSAPQRYDALLAPLAAMGLVVVAPLHIDSELLASDPPPAPDQVWTTRKQDMSALLTASDSLLAQLTPGLQLTANRVAAGHSYGAFGAQVAAGAAAAGEGPGEKVPGVEVVLAFSPPGPLTGFIEPDSWINMATPQLLITGSGDILPGFIDDWRDHAVGWKNAPAGDQWLWSGTGVDHYFGRVFGRLERQVPAQQAEFDAALATTQSFLARYLTTGLAVCAAPLTEKKSNLATLERR